MSGDKFDQLYNALKADGAVSGSRANFRNFVYASGKQGYLNRKKLYDALHADGAVSSKSYEEFAKRLGLHATNPQPRVATSQPQQQASKPQTAAQMAMAQGYRKPQQRVQQPTSYVQKPKQQARPQQPRSAFVQGLYQQDDAQRQQHIDYTSPKATQQMVTTRQDAQIQAARKAADTIVNSEQRRRNQPIVKTGTPADQSIVMTKGELEDQENREIGNYLDKVIGDEFKNAHARGLAALSAAGGPYTHGVGGADWYVGERAYQQQMDSQKQLENVTANVSKQIENVFSDPKVKEKVLSAAARLNMSPEDYINQHLAPALIQKTNDQFNKTQLNRMMAKGASDYIASGILNSLTGTLLTGLTTSKNQRQMQQEADAMTEEGMNPNYQPGIVGKAARGAVGFMADAPAFNLAGKAGAMVAGRVLGNGVAQAARLANMSKLQRAVYMAKNGAVSQGVTGILYGSTNNVAQNMSTGDDNSIGTNLKLAMKGGLSEGASFATMGIIGGAVGGLGYGIGVNGTERSVRQTTLHMGQKIGYEGFKVVSEGIGMHVGGQVANLIENGKFDLSVSGTLEDVANVVALKLTHAPKLNRMRGEDGKKESFGGAIARNFANFVASDAAKNSMWQLTSDDKDAIMASGGLANVKDMKGISASYQKIMADPNVSWDAKAKYSAMVMGVMPSSRPMSDYHTFTFEKVGGDKAGYKKYISEYAADGTLLSKRSYNTTDERENALYNDAILKENTRLGNGFALSVNADTSDRELQKQFLLSKGFDESKPLDYHVNKTLAAGLQDHGSAIYKEFVDYAANNGETGRIVDAVAKQNGMTREQLVNAFQNKDALKRTDSEQNACVQLRRAFEEAVFKQGESHPEQSQIEGKDIADDRGLGTEQPDGAIVVDELRKLRAAEQALEQAMDGNDVFKQVFEQCQKQGIRPVDAYDVLIQNGLTQEDIAPLADYINANARVQGMQEATKQKIEEHVGERVSDWSYHGTLNGEATEKGTTMLHVTWNGKDYIVGNGDVSFDSTGRAKEDVGEMLVCLDPETNTMEYIPTREVTFSGTERAEDYAAKYRNQLQMINSQPYNQAAQEQAMQDAAKPQQEAQPKENKDEEGKGNDAVSGVEKPQQGAKATVGGVEEAKGNAASKPVEQPQQVRKFADGTDVPMKEDGKNPDFGRMTPEQGAELYSQDFGENADDILDSQIKKAEQALKKAQKMKPSGEEYFDYQQSVKKIQEEQEKAQKELDMYSNIKKAMTAKKVAETVGKTDESEKVEGAHEAGSVAAEKFQKAPRLQGNHVSKRLPTGEKISGHYEIVPAESLTPSHDVNNGYKKSEGFPVDAEGRTINDRDYEHDKAAQQTTDQMAQKYSGQAITQVPTVSDEGIVYDGNGRTMAGQKAAKNGTDAEYIEDLLDNAQNYGFTKEQIAESGIEHPRLVMVTDERLPYDTATFAKFNRNEKKAQSNTEQAVAKAKTLTSEEVGAIVADIEGNGSLDAFFNNSKAINDLVRTLVDKGVIGQNEVAGFMDGPERLSAQGKEYVKNLLLGSVFKPETIRMLGVDSKIKNAAINGIRAIMDNLKLGDYSLRDEIDQAVQLLYEARRNKMSVNDLLRQSSAFDENARDRFPMIAQAMAQALEDKPMTFRELMNEYNTIAKNYNTNEGTLDFYDKLTPEQVVEEFLKTSKAIKNNNIKLYGKDSETEGGNDASSNEEPATEAGGAAGTEGNGAAETRNSEWFDQSVEKLKTAKGEERKQILDDMAEYVKDFAKQNGYDEPEVYKTKDELLDSANSPSERKNIENALKFGGNYAAYYENGKVHIYLGSTKDSKDLVRSFAHEYVHNDNAEDPSRVNMLVYSVENGDIKRTDLEDAIEQVCGSKYYRNEAARLESFGEDPIPMLADEALAHIVQEMYAEGEDVISQITSNPTLQKIAQETFKFRENERRSKQGLSENGNQESKRTQSVDRRDEGSVRPVREDSNGKSENAAGRGSESSVRGLREADEDKPNSVGFTPKQIREHQAHLDELKEAYIKALQEGKSEKEVAIAEERYEAVFEDHQNMTGIMDEATVADLWKKELEAAKASVPIPVMPKPVEPSNPIEKAAEDYKKEHPLTEDEILNTTAFDDLPEDQKQYCIDAAIDYLNGEDNSSIAEAYYRNAYEKRGNRPAETAKVAKADSEPVKAGQSEVSSDPMEGLKNAAEGYEQEKAEKERKQKEATQKVLNIIKASNEKAKTRKQLEAEKNAADNEFEAFMKELRKKRSGQLNSGFIDQNLIVAAPKMFSLAAKCAYTRIKLGMYDAKEVVKDLRERFKEAFDGFDKRDIETFYSEIMNQKWRDGDKRMSLNEWAEHYRKLSPEYKEKLEGDSKDAEERKMSEKKFIDRVNIRLGFGQKINGIVELRKMAEECGLKDAKDTDLQELAETAIVQRARGIASSASTNEAKKFELIKKLYENQPSLNQRDSERVMRQQYSTPAPYAFLADMYVKGNGKEVKSALEPSAGNGMLTIGLPMDAVHVNDIDAQRLANLRRQGFKNVTSQDGTQPFADKDVDVVVTNPPFGSATKKVYDGYEIGSLEGQMAINALESMKDDGRAAIIIGGKTEYAKNGSLNPKDKAFLGYLYSHYNVEDVINVDGSLYAKQGTTYPTRIILINGRRLDENAFPPVKSKARSEAVKDYDEFYKRINDDILRGERMDSSIKEGEGNSRPELDRPSSADTHAKGVRTGGERGGEPSDKRGTELSGESSVSGADDVLENRPTADREPDGRLSDGNNSADRAGADASQSEGAEARTNDGRVPEQGGTGRVDTEPSNDRSSASNRSGGRPRGQLQRMDESVRGLSTEKVTYKPKSGNPFTLKAVMPADQQEAVNKNLEKLGDADQFLVDELGYNDKDDLYSHLAAEQVDSVALALQQAKKGNAFIIGDMTGIGKGRQAASLIRYAKKQGQVPVYFTKTAGLLSDVYRDLVDIGSPELRPFVFGSAKEAAITDSDGNVVFPLPSKNEVKRVLDYIEKNGKLPKEYDYVLTTYSQVSNGIYEFDENGNRKERKIGKNKSFGAAAFSGQRRRDAIEKLMNNGYLILDESHTAGGNSGQGNYFQHIIQKAKNVTFFSATFAKRPDNMPIYALRTAMNQGGLKSSDLIDAVKRGGATLQEIMSQTLTQCGQMIRRERDMTGVTIDWRAIDEPEKVKEQREQYDSIIGLFNDIINFQKTYVSGYVEEQNEAMAAMQATMGIKRGTEALGIKNVPFASKAFNTVQQVLLSLKAKSAAERAIDYLKQGMKPVIALNNTNESQTGNIALGEEMDAPDLGTSLRKGLEGTLRYTSKNAKDESSSGYIRLEDLGNGAVEAYHALEKKIKETSTGLSLSPIDVIKNELEKAGYKVGELTGRSTEFVYNDNGTVTKVKRTDTDKKKLAREFNDGQIDALILNKSAATGISLHASSKYKDQRKRVMIVAQQQLDVNDEVQMRGRIDRTGQVARGAYEYVVSLIPAEQRLLMMFKAKLKSLDANTTSSQKSKFNEMEVADITNKYGDKVVREYMAEHLDLYSRMADPFGWEKAYGDDLSSIPTQNLVVTKSSLGDGEAGADASKLLGRMALLKVAEQEKMLNEIGELYANEIQRLNEMGENDLEITELPLKAKTISKEVWKEGAEPGGDNAFADNTYIEKVNMAILKKPMKAEEVKKAQDGLTGGKSWDEYRESKKAAVKNFFDQKIADETQKNEERAVKAATKAKEKYLKDAKKGQKDSGMSDKQIEQMAGYQYDNIYKQEKDKLNDVVKNLKAKAEMFDRVLDTFNTEDAYVLPVEMNKPDELSGFGNSYGRLIDIKITDNFSPNASSVSFATLDGRRKITFPITGKVGSGENKSDVIAAIDRMTRQASGTGDKQLRVLSMDVNNWDKLVSNESRKDGYIVTGNLMQALIDSKNQGVGGQLVKYTTDTGEVKTGILMPDRFKPTDVANEYPISSVADKFELPSHRGGVDEVVSSDGSIKIKQTYNPMLGEMQYEIRVPKSKAKGGKFFLDEDLMSMMNGKNFESRGNTMLGEFKENQLRPVLARLSNLGVKVREERKASEDGTHFREDRGVQYSKTDTKDVKNSRIIPEDVDKSVSSQIEKKFDGEVERLYGDTSDRPKTKKYIELMANKFAYKQYIDTFDFDDKGNKTKKYDGLKSVIDSLDNKLKDLESKYGISRDTNIKELEDAIRSEATEGYDTTGNSGRISRMVEEAAKDGGRVVGRENRNSTPASSLRMLEGLDEYKRVAMDRAAAERAREYLIQRFNGFRHKYGLEEGDWASKDLAERIFNDNNSDKDVQKIYDRIKGLVEALDTKLRHGAEPRNRVKGYYNHPENFIHIDSDFLSSIRFTKQDLASTVCHEMLHVVTSDIINLYRKGYGDLLTDSQRSAAKEVVDLYNEIKPYFDKHIGGTEPYALTNPAEMITELANPEWREIAAKIPAQKGWFRRIVNAIKKMLGLHVDTMTDLDRLDKAMYNVINNLDYERFQKGAELNDKIINSEASPVKVSDNAPVVVKHVAEVAKKVGAKVNMVNSAEEVTNKRAKEAIEAGKNITGWYDEKTGEVHLYMPNIHDRYTAEKTIWHEVVGHKGMRELLGEDGFRKFIREVWDNLDKPEYTSLKKLVDEERRYNPFDIENAIEEGIARLAEEGRGDAGLWNSIKNKVSDFLHEIGYRLTPNTKDVKYLLWLSKNLQKNPNDPYWKMRAEAVKYRLDHEDIPAVTEHDGMYFDNDGRIYKDLGDLPKAEYQEATDGQIHFRTTPSAGTALDRYHRALDAHGYMFTESYMDSMLSLKNLMTAIVPGVKIEDIASSENPYMLQNTMQGAMSDASKMFEIRQMEPLTDAMSNLLGAFDGKDIDEKTLNFNLYMIRKHGLERNRVFFVRDHIRTLDPTDARKMQKDWDAKKNELGEKLRKGDIDLKGYYDQMDEWIRNNVDKDFVADEHDYSGFHGMYGIENNKDPYNDGDVIADVMDREAKMEDLKKGSVKDFWSKVHAATSFGLYTDYKGGSQDRETYTKTSQMFDWYVPLRKYDEDMAEDIYGYINEKGDPSDYIGSVLMSAKGRNSLSETNILAQIGAMGNAAIYRAGNNSIKQAFMRFARNHDSQGLITESKVWLVKDGTNADGSDRWVETYPQIPKDAAPKTVSNIIRKFEADMKAKEATGDAKVLKNKADIGFRFERAKDKSQHAVDVMVNGKTVRFYINGNPRAAQALNGLLKNWNGHDTKYIGAAMRANAKITRFFAQACTSLNPEFTLRNMVKDYEFSTLNLLAKEGAKYTGVFEKYYFGLVPFNGMRSISSSDLKGSNGVGLFAKYRKGTLDMNNKVEKYFKEFMENGGETGFVQMLGMKDWTKKYKAEIKSKTSSRSKVAKIIKEGVFGNIEGINEVAENMARFATYCASRDSGRSPVRSAYDAKEVTVNFNRQGSGSAIGSFKNGEMSGFKEFRKDLYGFTSCYLRNVSMFFNAGIQSTSLLLKNAKNNPISTGAYIATGPMILAALMPLVNQSLMAMLDDDEKDRNGVKDPYAELPDYVRRNNLCIYTGKGEFVTIPLAIETRAFYGLGDLAADLAQNPEDRHIGNIAQQATGQIAQLVPVMDYMGNKDFGDNPVDASVQAFAPSSVEPWIEWERNKDWKGMQIERRGEFYKNDPAWERANSGTNSTLIKLNQAVNAYSNDVAKGNEEMLGNEALDAITNPSMLEHFGGGVTKGMGTFGGKVAGVIKKGLITHEEIETKDKPFIRSFFYTPSETSSMQRTKSKFYNYADELGKDVANMDKLKSGTKDPSKALKNAADFYNFYNSPKAQQIQILERANKQIKNIKKMRNKQTDTEVIRMADQQIGLIMQEAVEQLDKLN